MKEIGTHKISDVQIIFSQFDEVFPDFKITGMVISYCTLASSH